MPLPTGPVPAAVHAASGWSAAWPSLLNFVVFQVGWFACVLGAANHRGLAGAAVAALIVLAHLVFSAHRGHDARLVVVAVAIGLACDGALRASGFIDYHDASGPAWLAPAWILALWALLAITLDHSMRWLQGRPVLAVLMGGVGGPLSFLAGERLGALQLVRMPEVLGVLGVAWAVVMPLLLGLAARPAKAVGR